MANSTIISILDMVSLSSEEEGSAVKERMSNFSTAFGIFTLLPELVSLPIFAGAILIMYQGVEIEHPVFSVILNNLMFPLFVNLVIICSAFPSNMKIFLNVSAFGNMVCLLHHHTSWMVLSGLRYAYIVKPEWLHSTWPDVKRLRYLSVATVYISFALIVTLSLSIFLILAVPFGWPNIHFYAFPHSAKVTIVFIFFNFIPYSCFL